LGIVSTEYSQRLSMTGSGVADGQKDY
jgi:hypothetical protein